MIQILESLFNLQLQESTSPIGLVIDTLSLSLKRAMLSRRKLPFIEESKNGDRFGLVVVWVGCFPEAPDSSYSFIGV